jgi:hypothetical protein
MSSSFEFNSGGFELDPKPSSVSSSFKDCNLIRSSSCINLYWFIKLVALLLFVSSIVFKELPIKVAVDNV